ncbi:hypothetical protein EW146_g5262 [Bondarzewia mesenterica]|uniref:Inositol polyphosphate-related phosphatase domain-containing protein n=1 Tax=Bondarzewia mesenterica TaxID=1095465 RepID=A0A4S4LU43_9AGAM|nr:hypothetical protein EW146_g5262 [Bondarzewia mesenterica]
MQPSPGLIGGRVGNKGGISIGLDIAGTTIIFLNAHLATHKGKLFHRMTNLSKIKSRFIIGLRLLLACSITSYHAEYAEALAFDQLYNIMRNGQAFVGFHEVPINFPPTFQYDILRTLKHKRKSGFKWGRDAIPGILEVAAIKKPWPESRLSSDGDEHDNGEEDSMTSSRTSYSGKTANEQDEDEDEDDEEYDDSLLKIAEVRMQQLNHSKSGVKRLVKHLSTIAVHNAKLKWNELVSTGLQQSPARRPSKRKIRALSIMQAESHPASMPTTPMAGRDFDGMPMSWSAREHDAVLNSPPLRQRASSTKLGLVDENDEGGDKGVYDSSSKRRVPSWCTLAVRPDHLEVYNEDGDEESPHHRLALSSDSSLSMLGVHSQHAAAEDQQHLLCTPQNYPHHPLYKYRGASRHSHQQVQANLRVWSIFHPQKHPTVGMGLEEHMCLANVEDEDNGKVGKAGVVVEEEMDEDEFVHPCIDAHQGGCTSRWTQPAILCLIIFNAVVLTIEASHSLTLSDANVAAPRVKGYLHAWEDYALFVLFIFFSLEAFARICVTGFILDPNVPISTLFTSPFMTPDTTLSAAPSTLTRNGSLTQAQDDLTASRAVVDDLRNWLTARDTDMYEKKVHLMRSAYAFGYEDCKIKEYCLCFPTMM